MWGVVKLAMRAVIWRRTLDPPLVGLRSLLTFAVLVAAVRAGLQLVEAGALQDFNPYGLNAVIAWIALELAIASLFVRPAARTTALAAMFILSVIADIVMTAMSVGAPLVLIPLLTVEAMGLKRFGSIGGIAGIANTIGAAIGPIGAGRIYDATHSYSNVFEIFLVLSIIGAGVTYACLTFEVEQSRISGAVAAA